MRIAVVSDTHDLIRPSLPGLLAGADEIWHLGDVCDPLTLTSIQTSGVPLRVVRGNCDGHPWPSHLTLTRGTVTFHLVHIPPAAAPSGVAVVLHGHTHVPRDETDLRGVRWLNPGCITRPNRGAPPSFGWLTIKTRGFSWERVLLESG